jgi:3-oxoacyl-[acyl-carrier-protein] synthase-1
MLTRQREAQRVVVTGLGVVAPGAPDITSFESLLREGRSAIEQDPELERLGFACHLSARCALPQASLDRYLDALDQRRLRNAALRFALVAALEAHESSGLQAPSDDTRARFGVIFGAGVPGIDVLRDGLRDIDDGRVKRLGSAMIQMQMPSGAAAMLAGRLGFAGQVSCNASACATGTEALCLGIERIRWGLADVLLVGSCESQGAHLWGPFDALGVLCRAFNHAPHQGCRPLSEKAAGFVPGGGAGALVLESLSHALERGAPIYCEVLGGAVNSGGQRHGGSMTASRPLGIIRCIRSALEDARVDGEQVDAISGHLTATVNDPVEVECWAQALNRSGRSFPRINALKSLIGHGLSASGSIELVAAALQLRGQFLHASLNNDDLHPRVRSILHEDCVVRESQSSSFRTLAKASFGFGDVNACAILTRWEPTSCNETKSFSN